MNEPFVGLFPGQLSEKAGMGEALASRHPYVSDLFHEVGRRSGVDLEKTFFGGGSPGLHDNLPAQVGVYAVSMAVLDVLEREHGRRPAALAGYSLGTYAAFVAAGVLDRFRALDILLEVVRLLTETPVDGGMGFVIGLTRDDVSGVVGTVTTDASVLSIGNENAAQQFVLTGEAWAVAKAIDTLRPRALRAELLPMTWPMHSPRLVPIAEKLSRFVGAVEKPHGPALYAPMLGREVTTAEDAARVLGQQIACPSRWSATLKVMGEAGHRLFVEIGPGDVLTKLLRWTLRAAKGSVAESPETIATLLSAVPA